MIHMAENFSKNSQPNKIATEVNQYIKQKTQCPDAYSKQKEMSNEIALSLIDNVQEILNTDNSLETYVKVAIVGNILDFGPYSINTDFKTLIKDSLNRELSINDTGEFERALKFLKAPQSLMMHAQRKLLMQDWMNLVKSSQLEVIRAELSRKCFPMILEKYLIKAIL